MSDDQEIKALLTKLDNRQDRTDIVLEKINVDLSYHIKRTDILEDQLSPISQTHQQVIGIFKFVGWLGVVLALGAGLRDLFLFFKNF